MIRLLLHMEYAENPSISRSLFLVSEMYMLHSERMLERSGCRQVKEFVHFYDYYIDIEGREYGDNNCRSYLQTYFHSAHNSTHDMAG